MQKNNLKSDAYARKIAHVKKAIDQQYPQNHLAKLLEKI